MSAEPPKSPKPQGRPQDVSQQDPVGDAPAGKTGKAATREASRANPSQVEPAPASDSQDEHAARDSETAAGYPENAGLDARNPQDI